ncbi:MAG: cation:proton antiporter [Actinomycetota bacterium]
MGNALVALGGAFLAAGLLARLGSRVGLPTIPFFMAAGILFGPNTPGLVLVDRPEDLELFAAVGLIMLLFHLGLEFSLGDLVSGGPRLVGAGAMYIGLNVGGGLAFGLLLGWGLAEALVIAGAVGISSSAIVTKVLIDLERLANSETRLILGITVVQDLFLALYLALLQPVLGEVSGGMEAFLLVGRAFLFLLALFTIARFGASYAGKLLGSGDDEELLTVVFVGLAIVVAGLAAEIGVSEAIGAFMVGLILAETKQVGQIQRLVLPLRDAFAAVFFFVFGLSIDPSTLGPVALPVAIAVGLTLVLNLVAGVLCSAINGFGRRQASNLTFTLLGRGEFSLILASLAAAAGLDGRVGPFVALYVLVLALGSPILASRSRWLARLLPSRMFPLRTRMKEVRA